MFLKKEDIKEVTLEVIKSDEFASILTGIFEQALMREIQYETGKDKLGKVIEKTEKINVLDWVAKYLPYIEGALRGVQSDADQARNRANETKEAVNMLGQSLLCMQTPITTMARFSKLLEENKIVERMSNKLLNTTCSELIAIDK